MINLTTVERKEKRRPVSGFREIQPSRRKVREKCNRDVVAEETDRGCRSVSRMVNDERLANRCRRCKKRQELLSERRSIEFLLGYSMKISSISDMGCAGEGRINLHCGKSRQTADRLSWSKITRVHQHALI